MAAVVDAWHESHAARERPVNVRNMHQHLVAEYGYEGSYHSG